MIRCTLGFRWSAAVCAAALTCFLPAHSGTHSAATPTAQRSFPSSVQYGELRIAQPPLAQLNGLSVRTAPGFRLFSADNKLIFAHTVHNQPLRVAYVIEDRTRWLLTAWILTPQEQAKAAH